MILIEPLFGFLIFLIFIQVLLPVTQQNHSSGSKVIWKHDFWVQHRRFALKKIFF